LAAGYPRREAAGKRHLRQKAASSGFDGQDEHAQCRPAAKSRPGRGGMNSGKTASNPSWIGAPDRRGPPSALPNVIPGTVGDGLRLAELPPEPRACGTAPFPAPAPTPPATN
jgi:hypothetical protein